MTQSIPQLLEALGKVRAERAALGAKYGELRQAEGELKAQVEAALKNVGLKSAKTEDGRFSASIASKAGIVITDEAKAIAWLRKNQPNEVDHYLGLKATPFKTLVEAMLKNTGEVVDGTATEQIEYLTVRENKPKEVKNAV